MTFAIVYDSVSGNTKEVATALYKALPQSECIFCGSCTDIKETLECDLLFIGSWCDKGDLSERMLTTIPRYKASSIALFGTCGFDGTPSYFESVANTMMSHFASDLVCSRYFMCQGKMPLRVKQRYESLLLKEDSKEMGERMLLNFEHALTHPTQDDLDNAGVFAREIHLQYTRKN